MRWTLCSVTWCTPCRPMRRPRLVLVWIHHLSHLATRGPRLAVLPVTQEETTALWIPVVFLIRIPSHGCLTGMLTCYKGSSRSRP